MATNFKPEGYHTVTPYMVVKDPRALIKFVQSALDAELVFEMPMPDGSLAHAELRIGDSIIMLGQASEMHPEMPTMLYLYVPDVDATYARALSAGATVVKEPVDQFYGDRSGGVRDSNGNQWWFSTHKEDVSPEELERRMAEMGNKSGEAGNQ